MRVWVITSRAFRDGEYFDRLEETYVAKTEEEAKKIFDQECHSQGDWFWDGVDTDGPYDRIFEDDNTYVLISDAAECVVTKREVEI